MNILMLKNVKQNKYEKLILWKHITNIYIINNYSVNLIFIKKL